MEREEEGRGEASKPKRATKSGSGIQLYNLLGPEYFPEANN